MTSQKYFSLLDIRADIPTFYGNLHIEDFLDWIADVEKYFSLFDIPENTQVKYAAYKLRGGASAWWEHLHHTRRRQGKQPIRSWRKMKQHLFARFLPPDHHHTLFAPLHPMPPITNYFSPPSPFKRYIPSPHYTAAPSLPISIPPLAHLSPAPKASEPNFIPAPPTTHFSPPAPTFQQQLQIKPIPPAALPHAHLNPAPKAAPLNPNPPPRANNNLNIAPIPTDQQQQVHGAAHSDSSEDEDESPILNDGANLSETQAYIEQVSEEKIIDMVMEETSSQKAALLARSDEKDNVCIVLCRQKVAHHQPQRQHTLSISSKESSLKSSQATLDSLPLPHSYAAEKRAKAAETIPPEPPPMCLDFLLEFRVHVFGKDNAYVMLFPQHVVHHKPQPPYNLCITSSDSFLTEVQTAPSLYVLKTKPGALLKAEIPEVIQFLLHESGDILRDEIPPEPPPVDNRTLSPKNNSRTSFLEDG